MTVKIHAKCQKSLCMDCDVWKTVVILEWSALFLFVENNWFVSLVLIGKCFGSYRINIKVKFCDPRYTEMFALN